MTPFVNLHPTPPRLPTHSSTSFSSPYLFLGVEFSKRDCDAEKS